MASILVEKLSIEDVEGTEALEAEVEFSKTRGYEVARPNRPVTVAEAQSLAKAVSKRRQELEEDDFPF